MRGVRAISPLREGMRTTSPIRGDDRARQFEYSHGATYRVIHDDGVLIRKTIDLTSDVLENLAVNEEVEQSSECKKYDVGGGGALTRMPVIHGSVHGWITATAEEVGGPCFVEKVHPSGSNDATTFKRKWRVIVDGLVVRKGPHIESQKMNVFDIGEIVEQAGDQLVIDGITRMPLLGGGWISVSSEAVGGVPYLEMVTGDAPQYEVLFDCQARKTVSLESPLIQTYYTGSIVEQRAEVTLEDGIVRIQLTDGTWITKSTETIGGVCFLRALCPEEKLVIESPKVEVLEEEDSLPAKSNLRAGAKEFEPMASGNSPTAFYAAESANAHANSFVGFQGAKYPPRNP